MSSQWGFTVWYRPQPRLCADAIPAMLSATKSTGLHTSPTYFMPCWTASAAHLRRQCGPYHKMTCSLDMPGKPKQATFECMQESVRIRHVIRAVSIVMHYICCAQCSGWTCQERRKSKDLHAIIVPIWAIGVLVERLWGHSCVDQTGKQPCEHVCWILLAQVPASCIIACQRHVLVCLPALLNS